MTYACSECGAPMTDRPNQTIAYTMGGLPHVTLHGVTRAVCSNGHESIGIPKISQLHELIAHILITKRSPLAPEEVRFLRKHLGFDQAGFAKRMGVAPESVSRWETGNMLMAPTADRLLRFMVATLEPVNDYRLLDLLAGLQSKREPARMKLTHASNKWRTATG
jgi:putative zinc finger/helix-turn-helix YgiT family protein